MNDIQDLIDDIKTVLSVTDKNNNGMLQVRLDELLYAFDNEGYDYEYSDDEDVDPNECLHTRINEAIEYLEPLARVNDTCAKIYNRWKNSGIRKRYSDDGYNVWEQNSNGDMAYTVRSEYDSETSVVITLTVKSDGTFNVYVDTDSYDSYYADIPSLPKKETE